MNILIVCHTLIMCGGLMRFERFGREAKKLGHSLTYLSFGVGEAQFDSEFDQLTAQEAAGRLWAVSMVPGQGFPHTTIEKFEMLRRPNFGLRVQHVLNDRTFVDGFLLVNKCLEPDIVVFNQSYSNYVQSSLSGASVSKVKIDRKKGLRDTSVISDGIQPAPADAELLSRGLPS
jgi:hypothetical protein